MLGGGGRDANWEWSFKNAFPVVALLLGLELGGENLKYFESVNLHAEVDWQDNPVMKLSVEHVC